MMLWAWAGVPLGVYNIVEEFNIALRIQPQILTCLSLITWIQCFYYENVCFSRLLKECVLILCAEMVSNPFTGRCMPHRNCHDWYPSCFDRWTTSRKSTPCPVADYTNGRNVCCSPCSRCAQTLLGHLDASNRERHILHLRSH